MANQFASLLLRTSLISLEFMLYIVSSTSVLGDETTSNNTSNITCSNVNEVVYNCGACDATCSSPTRACSLLCKDEPECGCDKGYVRNKQGICILQESCNATKSDCKDVYCESGWMCKEGNCIISSEDNGSCSSITCASNSTCVDGSCVSANSTPANCPMYAIAAAPERCEYKQETNNYGCKVPVLSCEYLKCAENEEPKICGACDVTCGSKSCEPKKICKEPECGCKHGFLRDPNTGSKCVSEADCSNSTATPASL